MPSTRQWRRYSSVGASSQSPDRSDVIGVFHGFAVGQRRPIPLGKQGADGVVSNRQQFLFTDATLQCSGGVHIHAKAAHTRGRGAPVTW